MSQSRHLSALSRRKFLAWCGGAGIVTLASCGVSTDGGQTSDAPQDSGNETAAIAPEDNRIILGITDRIRTLDPADAFIPVALNILLNVGETLYTTTPDSPEIIPLLASDLPTISEDGTVYTIPLKEGIKFHDGTDFNAAAMAHSLNRFIETGGRPSFLLAEVVDSIAVSGDFELVITLKTPFSAFVPTLAFPGACAVSPEAHPIGEFTPETVVATGPYRLSRYVEGSNLALDRNDDYWGDAASNAGVDVQFFNTGATLLNAFKSGSIDIAFQTLEPNQVQTLLNEESSENWQVASQTSALIRYLVLNVTQPPLDNVGVRQAIAAALNRSLLAERVFLNQATPLYSLIPDNIPYATPAFLDEYGDRNLEFAKTALTEAGFSPESPARTTLWYASSNARGQQIAAVLKASLEADLEGLFQLELESVEAATLFENLDRGGYPMVLLSWSPDFLDGDNFLNPFLSCDESEDGLCTAGSAFAHGTFFHDESLSEQVQQQRRETDLTAREQLVADIQAEVAQQVPFIPLVQGLDYAFGKPEINGLQLTAAQAIPLWQVQKG